MSSVVVPMEYQY